MRVIGWIVFVAAVLVAVWWFFFRGKVSGAKLYVNPENNPPKKRNDTFDVGANVASAFKNPVGEAVSLVIGGAKGLYHLPNKTELASRQAKAIVSAPVHLVTAFASGNLSSPASINPKTGTNYWRGG